MRTLLLCSCFLIIGHVLYAQSKWAIDKQENDITVYTRYEEDSDFKAFKAVTTLSASVNQVVLILRDAENYIEWYGYTKNSKVLKRDKNIQYNYVETIFPWPFSNRDMVCKMTIDTSHSPEVMISLEGVPDYLPEEKGIVRMSSASGFIHLTQNGAFTELTYQFHSEPGDNLPIWLANMSIAELPYKTLQGLQKVVKN